MRIDASKAGRNDKADKNVNKTAEAFRPTTDGLRPAQTAGPGAFEKIMNEKSRQFSKDGDLSSKSDSGSETNESSDVKKEGEKEIAGKEDLRERDGKKDGGSGGGERETGEETAPLPVAFPAYGRANAATEANAPAARAILHVADLERIVAGIRSFEANNSRQVLIALKNSVLEGLELKLSLDESGKLKAEFLAANEKIKEQLKARRAELLDIFRTRGIKLENLEIGFFERAQNNGKTPDQKDESVRRQSIK
jgi:hypothetical protein